MRFRQVSEVLQWAQLFHDSLAKDYETLAKDHEKDRVGMLLHYLAEHQRALGLALQHYEEDAQASVLNTWFNRVPKIDLPPDLNSLAKALEKLDTRGVLDLAITFHDALIHIYQTLAMQTSIPTIEALFQDLAGQETQEKIRTVRDALRLEDL